MHEGESTSPHAVLFQVRQEMKRIQEQEILTVLQISSAMAEVRNESESSSSMEAERVRTRLKAEGQRGRAAHT